MSGIGRENGKLNLFKANVIKKEKRNFHNYITSEQFDLVWI